LRFWEIFSFIGGYIKLAKKKEKEFMATGEQEDFRVWLKSLIEDLESKYSHVKDGVLFLSFDSLKKYHWKRLWDSFAELENVDERDDPSGVEAIHLMAQSVILEAHGISMDNLDYLVQMDHYTSSYGE
jgi:hypothetical protein